MMADEFASFSITRVATDFLSPVLDDNDLATLRAFRALDHEESLVVRCHVVVPARDRGLDEIRGIEEHSRTLHGKRGHRCEACSHKVRLQIEVEELIPAMGPARRAPAGS